MFKRAIKSRKDTKRKWIEDVHAALFSLFEIVSGCVLDARHSSRSRCSEASEISCDMPYSDPELTLSPYRASLISGDVAPSMDKWMQFLELRSTQI